MNGLSLPAPRGSSSSAHPRDLRDVLQRAWRTALPLLDRATSRVTVDSALLEGWARAVDPTLSLRTIRAKVLAVIDETRDAKTFVLQPNARWRSGKPGSFITLHVVVDGTPVSRSYSISSVPSRDGAVAITVKRIEGGRVSSWLFSSMKAGHVLEISAAQGQFVLPDTIPKGMLMISAGSGITPVMSMLRHLVAQQSSADVAFLHLARSPDEIIFRAELAGIAAARANVNVVLAVEEADATWAGRRGRFTEDLLDAAAPDWMERPIYLCGPPGFMKVVLETLERRGFDLARLHYERFTADFDVSKLLHTASLIRFKRSDIEAVSNKPRTILDEAEARGLRPEHGCRMGVCGACRCKKFSGVVLNVATGKESEAGEENIYPCVSIARGTVLVDL